jgi:2-polyprenyl-6-hydroxyphenyl methylase/3-demethylubiquinone-9 3-methyltransferase
MSGPLPVPIAPAKHPCKICGDEAPLYGVVDFHKACNHALALAGIPVYYHRCRGCGFVFTTAFDGFSAEDFARLI